MNTIHKTIFGAIAAVLVLSSPAHSQADPDYRTAVNMIEFFKQECLAEFPDIDKIRSRAVRESWNVGPTSNNRPVSWGTNYGGDGMSLMVADNHSSSSRTCEVRANASDQTVVSVFNGLYANKLMARRSGAPESSWSTSKGMITIQKTGDQTSLILAK